MKNPEGTIVAMLTPFDAEGNLSEKQVRRLIEFLIERGVDGIFPVSSCGEYVHMDMDERKYLIDVVVDQAKGRVAIIPGTGATCYQKSIELANYAKEAGCDAIVLHGPFFFKNQEEVVEEHLRKVATSVDIPIFLYNIPFFANEITPFMVEKLAGLPNVIGIKDSSGNMINVMNLIEMSRKIKPDFKVLVGVEEILYPALEVGANGCMTATAGIMPEFMTAIYNNFKSGNKEKAKEIQFAILELIRVMKSVNFPQGFKEALTVRGIEMGPPKMSYDQKLSANTAHVKEKLEHIMNNLLTRYFPGMSLRYDKDTGYKSIVCPSVENCIYFSSGTKKYEECTMCGMCESDVKNSLNFVSGNAAQTDPDGRDGNYDLKKIIEDVTSNVLRELK